MLLFTLIVRDLPCNYAETVMWHANGWRIVPGAKYKEEIGQVHKTLHSWWKEKVAKPISKIDGLVKRVYREQSGS